MLKANLPHGCSGFEYPEPTATYSEDALLPAGGEYLYDTTLNVTWLRNANANGGMNWDSATTWAANLTTGSGNTAIDDWRLPTMAANPDPRSSFNGSTASGSNVPGSSSEMASLFFDTLGNISMVNTSGYSMGFQSLNTGSFENMKYDAYWLGTEYAPTPFAAWSFFTSYGSQGLSTKEQPFYAMAVRTGDVLTPVPEPETYAMLLAGLALMGGIARRRNR